MNIKKILLSFFALAVLAPAQRIDAQGMPQMPKLPIDKEVRYGKLPNGLTYYIRHNELPKDRASFYIAQKVGSVQEEESQRGLAHFLEHMCFNGTQHFPGNRIVGFCESIGVKFGENLNAYTSTDETVYNINDVPVSATNVDSCLYILHDWADGLLLEESEIDKERGVIHEEWRMRSSGSMRIMERCLPKLYPGSRYGERFPIGLMSVIDNFKPQELRNYYEKWYRPDLQGIIVVGDIDVDQIEQRIKDIFSSIKMPENAAAYEHYPVPDTKKPIYVVDKDKEQASGVMQVFFKADPMPDEIRGTQMQYVIELMMNLGCDVINARLNELTQKADCPFTAAGCSYGNYIVSKTKDALSVYILPKPGKDAEALNVVMQELVRVSQHGVTETELLRARDEFMSQIEKIYNNRDKQYNSFYIPQYVRHFLEDEPIPGIELEYQLYQALSTQMPVAALKQGIDEMFKENSTEENFVVFGMYPDKEGYAVPTADALKQAVEQAAKAKLEAYVDNVKNEPLVPVVPQKGDIISEKPADFGYTCWTLGNGAKVYFKKTDFNDSEVLFSAISFGGEYKVSEKDQLNLDLFDMVMSSTGLGNFKSTELEKKLAGKQASCSPALGAVTDNLSGSSTPKDLRTLFELIYLRFQKPCDDVDAYNNLISLLKSQLENAEKLPEMAFSDSVTSTIYQHHPRHKTMKAADLDKASFERIKQIYQERFATGADFDFYFTGNFDEDSLRLFVETYIASMPAVAKREEMTNLNIKPAKGKVDNLFTRAMETPKANIVQVWWGDLPYTMKDGVVANALGEILSQRYLKSIREEGSMAYSVGAAGGAYFGKNEMYQLQIYCPVKPEKRDSALLLMKQGIMDIAAKGVTAEELDKFQKFELKDYADKQKKNGYWQNLIESKNMWGFDEQTGYEATISGLKSEDIQNFVKNHLLKDGNCITVSMLPADFKE